MEGLPLSGATPASCHCRIMPLPLPPTFVSPTYKHHQRRPTSARAPPKPAQAVARRRRRRCGPTPSCTHTSSHTHVLRRSRPKALSLVGGCSGVGCAFVAEMALDAQAHALAGAPSKIVVSLNVSSDAVRWELACAGAPPSFVLDFWANLQVCGSKMHDSLLLPCRVLLYKSDFLHE